ncbi:PIN [Glarea lozoyensis ATCC 20868]|uniref:PIN n=1 Tax=Glarea lozoyensis (strain ATCC 20868 / MF5171) TaxID=1116229 RepID=S3DKL5_GLAL2|nr:PIN [Glarea lozoyensis ATCC 20868]EPE32596.1 PIN [Glarea lozoyensis ATCC 20868]
MGIKGIYAEIGPGERVALSKLAVEAYEKNGRPLRVAIDISIWQFQIQAGQGGSNPAIRTLYYRLLRLLGLQVQPLFIFDGPHKPPFKRGKKTGHGGAMVPNLLTKQLLKLFGFPFYSAPGEAEAECALLQREGIVDAVLSEDVDTIMFGCGLTLKNWSSENVRGNKTPTHVSAYYAEQTKQGKSGLDREGMILVALMSGGDYITEGIPGCGPKVACEAARAGFGKSLCGLTRGDAAGLELWRNNLAHEIQTNENNFFRIKHKALKIPEDFPNREVLSYYTHPVVSSASKITKLKTEIEWDQEVDVPGLRLFVAEAFDWTSIVGAKKFIRTIAPVLLVHKLRVRASRRASGFGDVILTAMNEMELVRAICGKRTHISSDGIPELRVVYHPLDIVGLDLDAEPDDTEDYGRDGLAPIGDGDQEAFQSDDNEESAPINRRAGSQYDPNVPDKLWIPETMAKIGVPLVVEDWESSQRDPREFLKQKAAAKRAAAKKTKAPKVTREVVQKGAMDRFVKVTKHNNSLMEKDAPSIDVVNLPPTFLAPSLDDFAGSQSVLHRSSSKGRTNAAFASTTTKSKPPSKARTRSGKNKPLPNANPWSLSSGMCHSAASNATITKALTTQDKLQSPPPTLFRRHSLSIDLTSSPLSTPPSSSLLENAGTGTARKHLHSPTISDDELPAPQDIHKPSPRKRISTPSTRKESLEHSPELPSVARLLDFDGPDVMGSPNINTRARRRKGVEKNSDNHLSAIDGGGISTPRKPTNPTTDIIILTSSPISPPDDPFSLPSSPLSSLPPISQMLPPPSPSEPLTQTTKPSTSKPKPKAKKFIVLRESLPGGWKEVDEEELELEENRRNGRGKRAGAGRQRWRVSEVEVLDLVDL